MTIEEELLEAVNILIRADRYAALVSELETFMDEWNVRPRLYDGNLAPLNALIRIGLKSRESYDNIIVLIRQKRTAVPQMSRADYQRKLMRARRDRISKVLELHELTTGKRLETSAERDVLKNVHMERWKRERSLYIAGQGELSWSERNAASAGFWASIDKALDEEIKSFQSRRSAHVGGNTDRLRGGGSKGV